jgi:hypothetical protein
VTDTTTNDAEPLEYPDDTPEEVGADLLATASSSVPIDYRAAWGAMPPKSNAGGFSSLDATVTHYTGAGHGYMVAGADHEACRAQVRAIQASHQAIPEQSDIEYCALACAHGYLMEGRIIGRKGGANGTADSNARMPSICALVGVDDVPTSAMLAALEDFYRRVDAHAGRAVPRYGHRNIVATACPGDWLSAWLTDTAPPSSGAGTPPPSSSSWTCPPYPGTGDYGCSSSTCLAWQEAMILNGYISDTPANRDGWWGDGMHNATARMQQSWGWTDADGIAGEHTWPHLRSRKVAPCPVCGA